MLGIDPELTSRLLGERRIRFYWEGEAPAEPKLSSAGASLAHIKTRQIDFGLPLTLVEGAP